MLSLIHHILSLIGGPPVKYQHPFNIPLQLHIRIRIMTALLLSDDGHKDHTISSTW